MSQRIGQTRVCVYFFILLAVLLFLLSVFQAAAATPPDVTEHWAEDHIAGLVEKKVMGVFSDGKFHPRRFVTRAQLAHYLVKAFPASSEAPTTASHDVQLEAEDVRDHWAEKDIAFVLQEGLMQAQNGRFRPNEYVTRSEVVRALLSALKLDDAGSRITVGMPQVFEDVQPGSSDWAHVMTAYQLDVLPPLFGKQFDGADMITRAELAAMLGATLQLQVIEGTVVGKDVRQRELTVRGPNGIHHELTVDDYTWLYRNNARQGLEVLDINDEAYVFLSPEGRPRIVRAYGAVTRQDLDAKLQDLAAEVFGPLVGHDGTRYRLSDLPTETDLRASLYQYLLELGFEPMEADSILARDWRSLELLAKEQIFGLVSSRLGIPRELSELLIGGTSSSELLDYLERLGTAYN